MKVLASRPQDVGCLGASMPSRRATPITPAALAALGRMRALAIEARPESPSATTATLLFALCDMARAKMFPGARILRLLRDGLDDRWLRLEDERERYIVDDAPELEEPSTEPKLLSSHASAAFSIAFAAQAHALRSRALQVEDLVVGLLLCTPERGAPIAAHTVLSRLELPPLHLLSQWMGELKLA
jgi:hypothetical protein